MQRWERLVGGKCLAGPKKEKKSANWDFKHWMQISYCWRKSHPHIISGSNQPRQTAHAADPDRCEGKALPLWLDFVGQSATWTQTFLHKLCRKLIFLPSSHLNILYRKFFLLSFSFIRLAKCWICITRNVNIIFIFLFLLWEIFAFNEALKVTMLEWTAELLLSCLPSRGGSYFVCRRIKRLIFPNITASLSSSAKPSNGVLKSGLEQYFFFPPFFQIKLQSEGTVALLESCRNDFRSTL